MASSLWPEPCPGKAVDGSDDLGLGLDDNAQSTSHSRPNSSRPRRKSDDDADFKETDVPVRKVFIGNLNTRCSSKEISNFFSRFGPVQNAHYARKKDGTRERFGFVTFYDPSSAERALTAGQCEGLLFKGHYVSVKKAEPKHQPRVLKNGRIIWTTKRPYSNFSHSFIGTGSGSFDGRHSRARSGPPRALSVINTNDFIDESKCVVHLLNDDCLMHVFSFIPKADIVQIERVCKRWQTVSLQTWLYVKELDFEWLCGFGQDKSKFRFLNTYILESVLKRCGPNLRSLDLSYKYAKLKEHALFTVAQECPNLKCLNLANMCLSMPGVTLLKPLGATLQRLVLDSMGNTREAHLATLFQHCPNLASVVLSSNCHLSGECLRSINADSLRELILDSCNGLRANELPERLAKFTRLERLSMNACISVSGGVLESVVLAVPQLRSLSLGLQFPLLKTHSLTAVAQLGNLVTLTLCHNSFVNDQVLKAIVKDCKKIEVLDISGCSVHTKDHTVTDAGMTHLAARMPRLARLKMSYMAMLTDRSVVAMAEAGKLRSLECRGTPTFTDSGLCRLIELCPELEHLDFSGCNFVSDKTVNAAIDAVKQRDNDLKLKLVTGGCAVWLTTSNERLLELDSRDLSEKNQRPDYMDDVYFFSDSDEDFDDLDGIEQFDWECQSMFLGDDIGELIFANQFLHHSDDSDLDDDLYFF